MKILIQKILGGASNSTFLTSLGGVMDATAPQTTPRNKGLIPHLVTSMKKLEQAKGDRLDVKRIPCSYFAKDEIFKN